MNWYFFKRLFGIGAGDSTVSFKRIPVNKVARGTRCSQSETIKTMAIKTRRNNKSTVGSPSRPVTILISF